MLWLQGGELDTWAGVGWAQRKVEGCSELESDGWIQVIRESLAGIPGRWFTAGEGIRGMEYVLESSFEFVGGWCWEVR